MGFFASLFGRSNSGSEDYENETPGTFPDLYNGMTLDLETNEGQHILTGRLSGYTEGDTALTLERLPGALSFDTREMGTTVVVRGVSETMTQFYLRGTVQESTRLVCRLKDVKVKAREAGAKGFKLVGCTCVGQDLQLRGAHYTEIFDGHAGNNYTSEAILATGGIDAVISEFNCTLPGIEPICDQLKIKQICIDNVAKKANAQLKEFDFQNRPAVTDQIIEEIVDAYKARRGSVPMNLMKNHGNDNTLTGISEISLKKFLGGSWQPLIDLIVAGNIKGVAGVVGCSNLTAGGHDVLTVDLVKELIARDIIVLTAGCSSGGIENCGLMTPEAAQYAGPKLRAVCEKLGIPPVLNFGPCLAIGRLEIVATELAEALNVDLPQLPLVLSAAQWLEEQALADGCYGLALGLPLHLGLPPFITGSKTAVQVLTEDMKTLTGGQVIINSDAKESADILERIILEKRQGLNI